MSSADLKNAYQNMMYKMQQEKEAEHIFHYTNLAAVQGILETGCIWMTHASYLNDTEEMQAGFNLFKNMVDDSGCEKMKYFSQSLSAILANSSFFVASFSAAPDMLSQWRGYCSPDAGYCLELKNDTNKSGHVYCVYEQEKKELLFKDLITSVPKDEQSAAIHFGAVLRGIMRMKHAGFAEEREIRWAFPERKDIDFRERDGSLIPYIKQPIDLNDIYAIWIGPGKNRELRRHSLEMYLEKLLNDPGQRLCNKPLVKLSKIPLR